MIRKYEYLSVHSFNEFRGSSFESLFFAYMFSDERALDILPSNRELWRKAEYRA